MNETIDTSLHAEEICKAMTKAGYMSGWFGDDSKEFISEQANSLIEMSRDEFVRWVENQGSNLKCVYNGHFHTMMLALSKG